MSTEFANIVSPHEIVSSAASLIQALRDEAGFSKGITSQQLLTLLALYASKDGVYQHHLKGADSTGVGRSAVNRNLDLFKSDYLVGGGANKQRVRGKGWVVVEKDPMNGKHNIARLTPLGRDVIGRAAVNASKRIFSIR